MLTAIFTSPESAQPMCAHESIEVIPTGLVGDRYATGKGFYSGQTEWDAPVTLIQQEPFEELLTQHGLTIEPKELRRNLVTKNINLNWLIGRDFQIGETVVLRGRKVWPPCMHIIKLTDKGKIINHLAKQCGIGADVLVGGTIRVGDPVFALGKSKNHRIRNLNDNRATRSKKRVGGSIWLASEPNRSLHMTGQPSRNGHAESSGPHVN